MTATASPVAPPTGPTSTSWKLTATTILLGVLSLLEAVLNQPKSTAHLAVFGGGGILAATFSTAAKILHDKGIHVASIQAAASGVAHDLSSNWPTLVADMNDLRKTVEEKIPETKPLIEHLDGRLSDIEQTVQDKLVTAGVSSENIIQVMKAALGPNAALLQGLSQSNPPADSQSATATVTEEQADAAVAAPPPSREPGV